MIGLDERSNAENDEIIALDGGGDFGVLPRAIPALEHGVLRSARLRWAMVSLIERRPIGEQP
jgi:hypothetical protein